MRILLLNLILRSFKRIAIRCNDEIVVGLDMPIKDIFTRHVWSDKETLGIYVNETEVKNRRTNA